MKQEFHVKIKKFTWKKYILSIRENDFQLKKEKSKQFDTYSLMNAVIFDQSEKGELKIMAFTSYYRILIKPLNIEDKTIILSRFESIVQKLAAKTAFSKDYFKYMKQISKSEEKNPYDSLLYKINTYQILMSEMSKKLFKFKTAIKDKLSETLMAEFMGFYNDFSSITSEMKNQFDKILSGVNKYFLCNSDNVMSDSDSSSDKENEKNNESEIKDEFSFMSNKITDFTNPIYDFPERTKLDKNIKCPENIIKEMITTFTKKQSSPVYFNEPISMCQKQCEKFIFMDLLTKASKEENKSMQICYIAAFIIGEIFTNLSRFLKPFSPIVGETFEYFQNSKNFRYYSENVKHIPQITAFIGETPDFAYYGDTYNDTSFKFLKGSLDLTFKNKVNIIFKNSKIHYVYNRPIVSVKGLLKPPMFSDYSGTTLIEDINDPNLKGEIIFKEQSWTQSVLGGFDGKVYKGEDEVIYLIGGNWQEEIYITDKDGNNKQILLTLDKKNHPYLNNNLEKYCIPDYSCNYNNINENLAKTLPKNDSRFRKDIRYLEDGNIKKAQMYKGVYEEKQMKIMETNKILFFNEKIDPETDESYYVPNGKYWQMKKAKTLLKNPNNNLFEVEEFLKKEEEKQKENEKKKKKEDKEKKDKETDKIKDENEKKNDNKNKEKEDDK